MRRTRTLALSALALVLSGTAAPAQLRPLDPQAWEAWEGSAFRAGVGGGVYRGQRASLAGTEGDLLEAGRFELAWRTGRIVLEGGGTVQRFFRDRSRFAAPYGGAEASGPDRHDSGDYRIGTLVRLTPAGTRTAVLRFGTRIPTTDNRVGLERDRTDFYALLGGRVRKRGVAISAESGVSINGTREAHFEQSDVWVYIVQVAASEGRVRPYVTVTGHADGLRGRSIRGNEDLGEIRIGALLDGRRWVRAHVVGGFLRFSPRYGFEITAGTAR